MKSGKRAGLLGPAILGTALAVLAASPLLADDDPRAAAIEGTWIPTSYSDGLLTSEGKAPPLTEEAAELYRERVAEIGDPDRQYDRTLWCAGPGIPRIMFMPYPFEIRADGDFVGFIYGWYRWHRVVDISGAEADAVLPQTMGYPVGHWDGDTLVIETTGFTDETILDAQGLPHSEDLRVTERIALLPSGELEDRFRIEDPEFYTAPWDAVMTYKRSDAVVGDDVCPDRIHNLEPATLSALP